VLVLAKMLPTVVRKARTLLDAINDFQRDPLACFEALDRGLQNRSCPAKPEVLGRVVAAYKAAKRDQQLAGPEHQANGQWSMIIERKLRTFDPDSLSVVLSNFFRNDAFEGLADYATIQDLGSRMNRIHFINNMLHDYRTWCELVAKDVAALQTPWVGNPFGYFIDGTLAVPGCFRHHYMAEKAVSLLRGSGVLAEIGCGYGELGYYALLSPGVHYVDFDLPEVLLVASYWLCNAMPQKQIVLFGEADIKSVLTNLGRYDAVLFPNFCLRELPSDSVDVFLNTRSLSEMASETIDEYLRQIARCCRYYFLHENSDKPLERPGHTEVVASSFSIPGFRMLSKTLSPWKAGGGRYREFPVPARPRGC